MPTDTNGFTPVSKQPGDLAKAAEWNAISDEVERLGKSKVDKVGGTMTGQLTVNHNIISAGYGAKLICYRLLTASWLHENAIFGKARSFTFNNQEERLDFGRGSNDWEKIFSVPLVPAGLLTANQSYAVRIAVSATDISDDADLVVGLSDGTTFVGFERSDIQNDEQIGTFLSGIDGELLSNRTQTRIDRYPKQTYQWFEVLMRLGKTTWISGRVSSEIAAVAWTSDRTIKRDNMLFLTSFIQGHEEEHGIHSIEVSIVAESPIPNTINSSDIDLSLINPFLTEFRRE